jgi:2-keto-4-pentenoate hydratase/2-oxohepta-3-ene-1,7-dioic acid hydratase in catechol pathway
MRLANLRGRAVLVSGDGTVDIERESNGDFGPGLPEIYERWGEFRAWAENRVPAATSPFDLADLGPPSPAPRQIFAIGLNYGGHAAEANVTAPEAPPTFTKFVTSLSGPYAPLKLPSDEVDWEVELVVVIGSGGYYIPAADAWDCVAGITVGQDFSERAVQRIGPMPQFSMAKSYPGFSPTGPWLVTIEEIDDPDNLHIECSVNGVTMQSSRTSELIFSVPQLIEWISAITPLLPGDIIFSGTPGGVGAARKPPIFLAKGDVVSSTVEGVGEIKQICV